MVRLTVTFRTSSSRGAQDLLESLRFVIATTRSEPGCQECCAWADLDMRVHYEERWATELDVRRRIRSREFTSLLGLMECASEPPDVRFDFVTAARGLDFVAEVRGQPLEERLRDDRIERLN